MARHASKFDQVVDTVAAPQLLRSLIPHMYMMRSDWLRIASKRRIRRGATRDEHRHMNPAVAAFFSTIPLAFAALFPVVNPLGTAAILLGLTEDASEAERRSIARAVSVNSVLLLAVVLVAGRLFLSIFGISVPIVQLAGGLVLGAMGWKMLFGPDDAANARGSSGETQLSHPDYSRNTFYPFTFPLTVGPGGVAVAITLSAHASRGDLAEMTSSQLGALVGIAGVGIVTYVCFANAGRLAGRLGASGLSVLTRLSAFIVVCLGAEICWNGARSLLGPWLGSH